MPEPVIAFKKPAILNLKPGTYRWCQCGRSKGQPFCDGSHQGTGFEPVEFVIDNERRVALCRCKHSGTKPYCDGSHARL
ncbi:MAG: CDGSH iron-sulfur domain-containing protein [Candidatus Neomarinimicrobiota bacterium]